MNLFFLTIWALGGVRVGAISSYKAARALRAGVLLLCFAERGGLWHYLFGFGSGGAYVELSFCGVGDFHAL